MRITNKIMQRNNLTNLNTNKIYQDKLSTQMSSQKKINRPSDDPVVAIRALRLRSNVTELTQYYSKNIPDAESWLDVTEGALQTLTNVVTNMASLCTKGANGPLTTSERQIILEQLKALGDQVYATGDSDYAGRYVFTGYRTNTPLSFDREQKIHYEITEQLDNKVIDTVAKVDTGKLLELNSANFNNQDTGMSDIEEDDITDVEVHRIRLAYNDCMQTDSVKISFQVKKQKLDQNGQPEFGKDGMPVYVKDSDGKTQYDKITWSGGIGKEIETISVYDKKDGLDPYNYVAKEGNENKIVFIPETGELLLGKNRYNTLMTVKDEDVTSANEAEIRVSYEKENWKKGDLRPEHYFYSASGADGTRTVYNESYLTASEQRQSIEYDVGYNQTIRVNSTADQAFKHGIGRETDDLVSAIQDVLALESVEASMSKVLEKAEDGTEEKKTLQNQMDAIKKALTLAKDKEQKLFEAGQTAFQGYLNDISLCITECGTRSSKLELIKNRTQEQKGTFETLKSENEDVDITEVAVQLTSADLTYKAALMATGKVSQTTLLNYL